MSRKRKKKYRGHYCWCCGRIRPNERFSRRGHGRHLCKDCQKLGTEELAFRQHQRNIDRLLHWNGRIRKKGRQVLERYLNHTNKRVRAYAQKVKAHNEQLRQEARDMYLAQREDEERMPAEYEELVDSRYADNDDHDPLNAPEFEEIPF